MHRMQSGGWPYSKVGRDSSKAPSLRAAVLRAAVFRSKVLRTYVAIDRHVLSMRACARAHTEALEVPEVLLIRHKANSVRQTVRV